MVSQVENPELSNNISEIHTTVSKIIETVEKKPDKYKKMNNFFGYYLPVTINILTKYDEIENQKLNTEDSKKFMESTQKMVKKINEAVPITTVIKVNFFIFFFLFFALINFFTSFIIYLIPYNFYLLL